MMPLTPEDKMYKMMIVSNAPISHQAKVGAWVRHVFDEATALNVPERALRAVEETIELAQACDLSAETVHRLVDYVYSRPKGEPAKEIAGRLVTVYAAAVALGVDADEELEKELVRIWKPEVIERVRRRQAEKRAATTGTKSSCTCDSTFAMQDCPVHHRCGACKAENHPDCSGWCFCPCGYG